MYELRNTANLNKYNQVQPINDYITYVEHDKDVENECDIISDDLQIREGGGNAHIYVTSTLSKLGAVIWSKIIVSPLAT